MNKSLRITIFCICIIIPSVFCSPPEGGSIEGSGTLVTREEPIVGFTKIKAGYGISQLTIQQGDEYQVTLHIDSSFIPYLHVKKQGDTLNIYLEENRMAYYAGEFQVEITTPVLYEMILLSVLETSIIGFKPFHKFSANLYSSSKLEGDLEITILELQVFNRSEIVLRGSADQVKIRAAEAGNVDLSEFPAQTAIVDAETGSTIKINVQKQLEVEATENSKVFYLGNPSINTIELDETSLVEQMQ